MVFKRISDKLSHLPPRIAALSTPEELGRRLIGSSGLNHPPMGLVVITFWAFDLDCWHGTGFRFFFPNYGNLFLG